MTPIEIKAEEKAKEIVELFKPYVYCFLGSSMLTNEPVDSVVLGNAKICALISCNQTIEALSSVKGMGKIHKVKFWKLVKNQIESM